MCDSLKKNRSDFIELKSICIQREYVKMTAHNASFTHTQDIQRTFAAFSTFISESVKQKNAANIQARRINCDFLGKQLKFNYFQELTSSSMCFICEIFGFSALKLMNKTDKTTNSNFILYNSMKINHSRK